MSLDDDDFLANFDVDAVVRNRQVSTSRVSDVYPRVERSSNIDTGGGFLQRDGRKATQTNTRVVAQASTGQLAAAPTVFPGLDLDTGKIDDISSHVTPAGTKKHNNNHYANSSTSSKRLKVTPSPHSGGTSTALGAVQSQNAFGDESSFSMGSKTNTDELDVARFDTTSMLIAADTREPNDTATFSNVDVDPIDSNLAASLEKTLERYFGYSSFRPGQMQVIKSVLEDQRDTAVFWATGQGKSLCYQLPPLHSNQVALVVSPLISLMQDQVNKLNGLSDQRLATYLGSAQTDVEEEIRALSGEYPLVYLTPEKLLAPGVLDQFARMHQTKKRLCLVAIDESHCVSDWGHDFRPEFRSMGELRSHAVLRQVPLMALTATAVPRVQQDVCDSLRLRNPNVQTQSFDRPNLEISVHKKKGSYREFEALVKAMQEDKEGGSTIIYAPTRDLVDGIALYLQQKLGSSVVQAYHGSMSIQARSDAHINFLVGRTRVIVATVAFGMGIDKPDIRRVIHYGPPKTVEEYYQQIGRAGRDGLYSQCTMYISDSDFVQYKSDFYMGRLEGNAKVSLEKSIDALQSWAHDTVTCRRKALLTFFQQSAPFGERCGTCDNCRNHAKYGSDSERDFANSGARIVLTAVAALREPSMTNIEKILGGHEVDSFRYAHGYVPSVVTESIKQGKENLDKKRSLKFLKELVAPLVGKGYLSQLTKKAEVNGYSRTWSAYEVTTLGRSVLRNISAGIVLPVPPSLRDVERLQEDKRQQSLKQLKDAGIKLESLPEKEVEEGDGDVIRAFRKWNGFLERLKRSDKQGHIDNAKELVAQIREWRSLTAQELQMAPASVLAEHQILLIAYTVATMASGAPVQREALVAVGVRTRGVDSLVTTLNQLVQQRPSPLEAEAAASDAMIVFDDAPFTPAVPWKYAIYKPNKKTGVASWESSHRRFLEGEHAQTISMSPENGRPIQVATVVAHILDGLLHGRPVPLRRLAKISPPPTQSEWEQFEQLEAETNMDVIGDPSSSGVGGDSFTMTEFLRPIMGDTFVATPPKERDTEEVARFSMWCQKLKWYLALRRANYQPLVFESEFEEYEVRAA